MIHWKFNQNILLGHWIMVILDFRSGFVILLFLVYFLLINFVFPYLRFNKKNRVDPQIEMRFAQLLDEQDHKRCTEGNKNALLAEKLDRLRALKDVVAKEDWMFVPNNK